MLEEFYNKVGGDYNSALARLANEERMLKYLNNLGKYTNMDDYKYAVDNKDATAIFEYSHSLKGVALNLSLTRLAEYASELCEATRSGNLPENLEQMFKSVYDEYQLTIEEIAKL